MANDVVTLSNPPITLVEEEEFAKTSLDVNVSQRSHDKEMFQKVVCIQVNNSMWDHQSSPNPHALTIYLKFVPTHEATLKRFEECQCEDDDVRLHYQTWVLGDDHYCWLQGPINPLSMEHQVQYLAHTIRCILDFLQL